MKIALSAPHTPNRPGVQKGIVCEYGLSSAVIGDLVFRLQKAGHQPWLIGADSNVRQIARINELKADCGLELHFNAFVNGSMHGTEVLHAGSERGAALAACIQKPLVDRLKTRDRGIKIGHFRGDVRQPIIDMLVATNCPFVITEPLFLSHPGDFEKVDIPLISIALLEGLEAYRKRWVAYTNRPRKLTTKF